jgi:flavodoxin
VKMSKGIKIAGLVIGIICVLMVVTIVWFVAFMAYVGSDTLSSKATGSELLKPDGPAAGMALIVYNPGLSGAPKEAATQIAHDLQARGYEVTLAGVNSEAAANVSGYDVIVAGGPIYGGKVSPSVYTYLQEMAPPAGVKVGAFAIGSSTGKPFPDATWLKATVLLPWGKNADQLRTGFVAELLE